jgi:type I restriction enzyme S subunit
VAKIDSLTHKSKRARDHLDHIPRLVEKYKQAVLSAAFRGDLTPIKRNTVSTENAWKVAELSTIADIGTGATPKRGTEKYYHEGTIPWVTSGCVNDPIVNNAEEYITPTAIQETNCEIYPVGTLLVAMYGEGKTRGKVSRLGIAAATNQALAAIMVHPGGPAEPNFVLWYLRSKYLELREQAAGGVQPNLNLGILKRQALPLPPKSEQEQIVRRIESAFTWIDRLAADATSARKLIDHLDQSILAKAFRGELVPQNSSDEPASSLLEHILIERATHKPAKKALAHELKDVT